MSRSPVTDLLNQFEALNDVEQKVFLDFVAPQPEPEPVVKQTRKKRGPSKKAQSLSSAISSSREAKADAPMVLDGTPCTAKVPGLDVICGETTDRLIHDPNGGYAGYHPFESSAPVVEKKSRRRGAAASSTPSTETNLENALAVGAGGD